MTAQLAWEMLSDSLVRHADFHLHSAQPLMLPHAAAGAAAAGGEAAGNSPAIAALHLDLALPLIKQQITWPNFNPISLIKEASDKQKVVCKFVERALPTRPGAYHPHFQQQIIWEGQVSLNSCVDTCWHSELGYDTPSRYLALAGTPVNYYQQLQYPMLV